MLQQDPKLELRELVLTDGYEIYEMLQHIGPGENNFFNSGYGIRRGQFRSYLRQHWNRSKGIYLQSQHVQQTLYWLYADGKPVGYGKLRHRLNDALLREGGHIGYIIQQSERNKGYGTAILRELIRAAAGLGLSKVLLTCDENNARSQKVIERNGGVLTETSEGMCKYWIHINVK